MILSIHIHHLALIEDLTVPFFQGMHVLTGETGAGKSIVVDAVNLVLGGRADRELIRTGTEKAWVEAVFDASDHPALLAMLQDRGLDCDEGTVTLYRQISRTGRNICRVCGMVMPLAFLKETAEYLMDVHGQHEHRFLMDPTFHLQFLDGSGDAEHQALLRQVEDECAAFIKAHRVWARLLKENSRKEARMNELDAALKELNKARLKPGEEEALLAERDKLNRLAKVSQAVISASAALAEQEGFGSPVSMIKEALDALRPIRELGEPYTQLAERCENAYLELQQLSYDLADQAESSGFDPRRLEQIEGRLDLIRRLERCYGETVQDVLEKQDELRSEMEHFTALDDRVAQAAKEDRRRLKAYRASAAALSESRRALALCFEQRMTEQLHDLGMEKTVFKVSFAPRPEKPQMPKPDGDDQIEFMISPNPGEPPRSLSKTASGGELSRIMLALKTMEAEQAGVGCMVFDEIDTGISGRMAQVVAEKMAQIAARRQVICVTHLPQIAAMAGHEYLVEKRVEDERTNTHVQLLNQEQRVDELARMLSGTQGLNEASRSNAKTMLQDAESFRMNVDH